jgi:hypothetical protein
MLLAECPTCEREMPAALLPLHLSCGTCTPRGSGGAAAEMAHAVQDSVTSYTPYDGPEEERYMRWKRRKRADHLMSKGGTVSNYGPNVQQNVKARQKLAEHVSAGGTASNYGPNVRANEQRRQNLAGHVSAGGTVANFGPNVQQNEQRRQNLADHLMSDGGTVANYAPNERKRQNRAHDPKRREQMVAVQQQLHSTTTDLFDRVLSRLEDIPKTTDKCTDGLMDADTPTLGMLLVPLTSPPELQLKEDWRNFKHTEGQEDKMHDAFAVANRLHLTYWG